MKRAVIIVGGLVFGVLVGLTFFLPEDRPIPKKGPSELDRIAQKTAPALDLTIQARLKIEEGQLDEAQRLLAKAAALDPELVAVHMSQAYLDMARKDFAAA